jgi:hypothetical protein
MSEADKREQRRQWQKEYDQRDYRKEQSRIKAKNMCRQKKLISTAARFEEHTLEELLMIAMLRCRELGIDYVSNENVILAAMQLLHGAENDQSVRGNIAIPSPRANQTTAQESRASQVTV